MSTDEKAKLKTLLEYWIEHNEEHSREFKEWAEKARRMGEEQVATEILQAVENMDRVTEIFEVDDFVPAPAQGSLHIQCREDNAEIREILDTLNDDESRVVVEAEREFSRIFDGGCHTPMGCAGKLDGDKVNLKGMYYYEGKVYRAEIEGSVEDRIKLAGELAEKIRGQYNG